MEVILIIILAVFTVSLGTNTDTTHPIAARQWEFKRAIKCIQFLTDSALLSRYRSHSESTVQSMWDYLQWFHDMKNVFLRFRASKASKGKADNVTKELTVQNSKLDDLEKLIEYATDEKACTLLADKQERTFFVNEALVEDSHFNFPKIYLLSH